MNKAERTTLIGHAEIREMLGMQTQSGLDKLRARDPSFPKPIKMAPSRQARARFDLVEVEKWISDKKAERDKLSSPRQTSAA